MVIKNTLFRPLPGYRPEYVTHEEAQLHFCLPLRSGATDPGGGSSIVDDLALAANYSGKPSEGGEMRGARMCVVLS